MNARAAGRLVAERRSLGRRPGRSISTIESSAGRMLQI
jgi:hypothetical protein